MWREAFIVLAFVFSTALMYWALSQPVRVFGAKVLGYVPPDLENALYAFSLALDAYFVDFDVDEYYEQLTIRFITEIQTNIPIEYLGNSYEADKRYVCVPLRNRCAVGNSNLFDALAKSATLYAGLDHVPLLLEEHIPYLKEGHSGKKEVPTHRDCSDVHMHEPGSKTLARGLNGEAVQVLQVHPDA